MKRPTCEKNIRDIFTKTLQNQISLIFGSSNPVLSCRQYVTVVCGQTHHRSAAEGLIFVIFWPTHTLIDLHNSHLWPFYLITLPTCEKPESILGRLVSAEERSDEGGDTEEETGNRTLIDFNCRQPSFREKVTHTWCWCLGTRVLEDPVVGVGGEGEGGGGEFLVHNREGGGCGSHPTSQATIQLWQGGHSPTISAPSWVFQSHPLGFILAGFNSFSSWPTCSAHFSFALQACCPYFRFGQISITLTWIRSKKSWWQIVQTKNMNWCLSHI